MTISVCILCLVSSPAVKFNGLFDLNSVLIIMFRHTPEQKIVLQQLYSMTGCFLSTFKKGKTADMFKSLTLCHDINESTFLSNNMIVIQVLKIKKIVSWVLKIKS